MTVLVLSLVLAAAGCLGLWLGVQGRWQGPAIGLAVQPVWAVFAVATGAYGLLATCVMYGAVNAVNLRKLWQARPAGPSLLDRVNAHRDMGRG